MLNLLKRKQVRQLLKRGWQACDLHVHSGFSYDVRAIPPVHPKMLHLRSKYKRMTYFTITDHDTTEAYNVLSQRKSVSQKRLPSKKFPFIVRGVELTIHDTHKVGHTIHLNIYDFTDEEFNQLLQIAKKGCVYKVIAYLEQKNLPFVYNHPFWCESHEELNEEAVIELIKRCPVIEHNLSEVSSVNKKVLDLAKKFGKGVVATTDSHFGALGDAFVITPPAHNFREFFDHIKNQRCHLFAKSMTLNRAVLESRNVISQVFERVTRDAGSSTFNPDTGNKLIDALSIRLSKIENSITKSLLRKFFEALSSTKLPAIIFMLSKHKRAYRILKKLANQGFHKKQGFLEFFYEHVY